MTGIAGVWYEGGWAVTNDALLDTDKFLEIDGGKKISRHVLTLKLNCIFEGKGKIVEGQQIECILKTDDGKKLAFAGVVKSKGKHLTVIDKVVRIEFYTEILNKIKQWQIQQT